MDSPFWGPVYKMHYQNGNKVETERELNLPDTAMALQLRAGRPERSRAACSPCLIGPTMHMRVYNDKNQQMWISGETYNASSKFLEYMELQGTDYESSWWYLLQPPVPDRPEQGRPA